MVHGENRIPYWIDRRLTSLAEPDDDATISFGLPFELGDCPYGKSRLDPVTGDTNNLEEGVAVAFSLHVQPSFGVCIQPSIPSYLRAFQLARILPGGPLRAAGRVRDEFGALNDITVQNLQDLFPSVGEVGLGRLVERFTRNAV